MYKAPTLKVATSAQAESISRHTLILTHSKRGLPASFAKGAIPSRLAKHAALKGDRGAKLVLHGDVTLVVMGIGELESFTPQEAAEWGENAGHALIGAQLDSVQLVLPDELRDPDVVLNFLKGISLSNYKLEELKSKKKEGRTELKEVVVSGRAASALDATAFARIQAIVEGIVFARDIIELPSSVATPSGIVERFRKSIDPKRIELEVWDEKKIAAKKMGLIQAVSAGSGTPPRLLVARLKASRSKSKGGRAAKTLYLVGKGVTFDTGGVNLKVGPWKELIWMKKDMGGAAAVLGAMISLSKLQPDLNVVAITPLTTNQIGPDAIHPGDVFTSFAGKTVEIQNTDAEGRLVLADALHLAVTEKADWIVDAATLTGACVVALGLHHSGLFSNNPAFAETVRRSSESSGEPAWPMPMSPRYGEELKSQIADLSNMGKGRDAGATLGAKFLENFVAGTPWVHLDIAGTVDLGEPAAGGAQVHAAGRMVHTFVTLAEELNR